MKPYVVYEKLPPMDPPAPKDSPRRLLLPAVLCALLGSLSLLLLLPCFGLGGAAVLQGQSGDSGCGDTCRAVLVESTPQGVPPGPHPSTFSSWLRIIGTARRSLDIASFYWTLSNRDTATHEPSAAPGERILAELLQLPRRGVAVRVAVSAPTHTTPMGDLLALQSSGAAVRAVDVGRLAGGVLHTKLWVADGAHVYLGSANMDWRSLTQVKELGVAIYNCSCVAQDVAKVFEAYWALGAPNASIPTPWPSNFSTPFNMETPLRLQLNGTPTALYFSSSPPSFCAAGRTPDLNAILGVIDAAQQFISVAVMSYLPATEFRRPDRFWPEIDDSLRRAVFERGVAVRLLVGCWAHSKAAMFPFLRSLAAIADNATRFSAEVRLFVVPSTAAQSRIPYARVSHQKYMVTEKAAYIGTSNWSADYFQRTAGSALVLQHTGSPPSTEPTLRAQLQSSFERDWGSPYSIDIGDTERWQQHCGPPRGGTR